MTDLRAEELKVLWMGRALVFNLLKKFIRRQFACVQHMTIVEFAQKLADSTQPLILDARSPAEYAVSHLAEAQRIDVTADLTAAPALIKVSKDRPIVVYCSVGYRSAKVAQRLQQAGFQNVFNLEGGLFQWANEGRSLVHAGQPTQRVHPYSALWGTLVEQRNRLQEK
ncbi:MAG TPA: rhodanese-like domain-containing protein [Coleofasciculaceae cyanobacterium]